MQAVAEMGTPQFTPSVSHLNLCGKLKHVATHIWKITLFMEKFPPHKCQLCNSHCGVNQKNGMEDYQLESA